VDQPLGATVEPGGGRIGREEDGLERPVEERHVDQQDAEQRKAAQDVQDLDALRLLNGSKG